MVTTAPERHGSPSPSFTSHTFMSPSGNGFHSGLSAGGIASDIPESSPVTLAGLPSLPFWVWPLSPQSLVPIRTPIRTTTPAAAAAGSKIWSILFFSTLGTSGKIRSKNDGEIIGAAASLPRVGFPATIETVPDLSENLAMRRKWIAVGVLVAALAPLACGGDGDLKKAQDALQKQDFKAAREHAEAAVKADPKSQQAHLALGMACLGLRDNAPAAAALTVVIQANPKLAFAYDRRGDAYLKLGKFAEAVKDFDKVLELTPDFAPQHWRRGIALYYAGRYADGAKQFETHKKANPEDVENAVWHYLCNARATNKETAKKELIDVTKDARVPMAEIQKLFAGKLKPEDVLAAAEKVQADTEPGTEARFYAHLYVALWYEAEGDKKKVLEHLTAAVEKYKIGHYMWDVANAHLPLAKKK